MTMTSSTNGKSLTSRSTRTSQVLQRSSSAVETFQLDGIESHPNPRFDISTESSAPPVRQRTIMRALVIGIGGSGIEVASSMRGVMASQGTTNNVAYLALDTDETSQKGADGCPGFADHEFVHLSCNRIGNVVANPEVHPMLAERHQLTSTNVKAFMQRVIAEGVSQGGQVRRFGNLGLHSNYSRVRAALQQALAQLTGAFSDLEKQLDSTEQIQISRRLSIFLAFSTVGGTGSSIGLDVGWMLRSLTKHLDVEITACMIMPSAFAGVMSGYPDQRLRMQANSHALLLEMNGFTRGLGVREKVMLGPDERNAVPATADLFNHVLVVGPEMADGRSIGGLRAVKDRIGLALAAHCGTEASDHIALADANQATLRGLTPDRVTQEPRGIGTVNAVALTFPADRIAEECANQAVASLIRQRVQGAEPDREVSQSAEAWMTAPIAGKSESLKGDQLTRRFSSLALPSPAAATRTLFRHRGSNEKVHLKTKEFVDRARTTLHKFRAVQQMEIQGRLREATIAMTQDCLASLRRKFNDIATLKGFLSAHAFVENLNGRLAKEQTFLKADIGLASDKASTHRTQAEAVIQQMDGFFRNRIQDKKRKDLAANQIEESVGAFVRSAAGEAALEVVTLVIDEVSKLQSAATQALLAAKERSTQLRTQNNSVPGANSQRITTKSLAEIDIATPEVERALYRKFSPDNAELLKTLSFKFKAGVPDVLGQVVLSTPVFESLKEIVTGHFNQKLKGVSIVDVLAEQLAAPETANNTQARIKAAIVGCQPLWRAESRHISTEFADTIIIGVPHSRNAAYRERVTAALINGTTRWINPNGQYNGEATHVMTGDPHRIYVLRRTQGACLYYLPEVAECEAAYREWNAMGGHSVHIFNDDLVAKMPPLLPSVSAI